MRRTTLILAIILTNMFIALPCLWDYDTIEMERQQFPSVIELISGKFLRHSPEFYYWRIKDREKKLEKFPDSLSLYDDLAVSWSKIGNDEKAIEIILKKDRIKPGMYETYANLGTFYIHNGQLKEGVKFIDKAIKINPNAHFGREIYQKYVVEYVLEKMNDGKISLPLAKENELFWNFDPNFIELDNFYGFLVGKDNLKITRDSNSEFEILPITELEKAIIGVMGMMKFGNYNSPVLLEILGDLLMNSGGDAGARHLAARAYLKASYEMKSEVAKKAYVEKAVNILSFQMTKKGGSEFSLLDLEKLLKEEIEFGNNFYAEIRENELRWIKSNADVELEFSKKYYEEPKIRKRIQRRGKRNSDFAYIFYSDTSSKQMIDYRPILKEDFGMKSIDIDSLNNLYERILVMEEKVSTNSPAEEPEGDNMDLLKYIFGFSLPFLGIIFIIFLVWLIVKKRQSKI